MRDLTAERLRELLHYEPETGAFTWRRDAGTARAGRVAGTMDKGYVRIGIDGDIHKAHRLAFLYVNGRWPLGEVDHLDGARSNNAWPNLRDVSRTVNQQNQRKAHRRGGSGLLGVSLHKATGKWRARVWVGDGNKSLGLFDTRDAAHEAYIHAKREFHKGCTL